MLAVALLASVVAASVVPSASGVFLDPPIRPVVPSPRPEEPRWDVRHEHSSAGWAHALDRLVNGSQVSVTVGVDRRIVFTHLGGLPRIPASNQKLLISMAALDRFGAGHRFPTIAGSRSSIRGGVLRGNLWLIGGGDPGLTSADISSLAGNLRNEGLTDLRGSVIADTGAFDRGWWAPGWIPGLSRFYVARPTALALDGNQLPGPEAAAARVMHGALTSLGVKIARSPGTGDAPAALHPLAGTRSDRLGRILEHQNHGSVNFDAEMLTKALGAKHWDEPGSTANGAAAIEVWGQTLGVGLQAHDGSGLSHRDRITTVSLVSLLLAARHEPWAGALLTSLPSPGEGTLSSRLGGIQVHAKTGTLFVTPVSALSGYVRAANGRLVAFSVLSRGLSKSSAMALEDAVVRTLASAPVG